MAEDESPISDTTSEDWGDAFTPRLVKGIPDGARALFHKLALSPVVAPEDLAAKVTRYLAEVRAANDVDEDVDLDLAEDCAKASLGLLKLIGPSTPSLPRRLIQAAVLYFILDDDAEGDLTSVVGFDDDAQVINAVVRHIGHNELLIEIP